MKKPYKRKKLELVCEICGSDFKSYHRKTRFCSSNCLGHERTNHDWDRERAEEIMILRDKGLTWKEVASQLTKFDGTGPVLRALIYRKLHLFTEEEQEKFFPKK